MISFRLSDFEDALTKNKSLALSVMFYICGLLGGSLCYKAVFKSDASYLKNLFTAGESGFISVLTARLCLYLAVFIISFLISFSILGFLFINVIPLICGFGTALKISYYYSLSALGIGYSILITVPETSLFITLLVFLLNKFSAFSKSVFDTYVKKSDIMTGDNRSSYLKTVFIFLILIVLSAVINSAITYFVNPLIQI